MTTITAAANSTTATSTPTTSPSTATATSARRTEVSAKLRGPVLSAVRIVSGFLFACHGAQGFGAFGGMDGHGTGAAFGVWPTWWAAAIELLCGILLTIGLGTRTAAFLSSGVMAYAYFTVHLPMGLLPVQNMGDPAALNAWIFLLIAVFGGGPFALDTLLRKRH